MSRLNRRRSSDRLGERVEFRFSGLRAVQVPVVSDRLLLSIISVDTGKTIARSSKAAARNGICQWPDSILESIWFSQDEASKQYEDCQCRIVVSMGSTKSGILGEVFLNLTNYFSSIDSTAVSLPLKKCNSGTVLQLKIQCLGTKSKSSGHSPTNDVMSSKPDGSYSMDTMDARFSSGYPLDGVNQVEVGIGDISNSIDEGKRSKTAMQAKHGSKQGNNDLATDNGGCSPANEEPDLQAKIQSLESKLAEALAENSMYRTQLKSPMAEGQPGSRAEEENNDGKIAQLESELKDMQDRLLTMSMQYAEVEAQREELVMELKNANAKKGGRWF